MTKRYPIAEIFGPTIQGEGIHAGKRTQFIRFSGCDTMCDWCDTKEAWEIKNYMTRSEILDRFNPALAPIITITGGNPLLYDLGNLVEHLFLNFHEVHVETQGTIWKDWLSDVTFVSVSPKPDHLKLDVLDKITKSMSDRCQFKIVVFTKEDILFLERIYKRYPYIPVIAQIGWPSEDKGRWIAEYIAKDNRYGLNVRVLPQIHRIFWKNEKGV